MSCATLWTGPVRRSSVCMRTRAAACSTPEAWPDTGRQLLKLLDTFPSVRYLDVGGGLGVPEKAGQPGLDMSGARGRARRDQARLRGAGAVARARAIRRRASGRAARTRDPDEGQRRRPVPRRQHGHEQPNPARSLRRVSRHRQPESARQARERAHDGRRSNLRDGRPLGLRPLCCRPPWRTTCC